MAKRHSAGPDLLSQIRRCQELISARSGVDEFYELVRLLLAKALFEKRGGNDVLDFQRAQDVLTLDSKIVERFVEGGAVLSAPAEVINECLRILAPTSVSKAEYETLDVAFEGMTARLYKSEKGQYFTPRHVVDFCINVLRPHPGETICDPACGSAAFLQSANRIVGKKSVESSIYGFDISRRAAKTAELMSFLACNDSLSIHQLDSLSLGGEQLLGLEGATIEDTLRLAGRPFVGFDVIATNPPFAGDVSTSDYAQAYEVARFGGPRIERDALFIERCVRLLRPGGRLAIVLPDNKISATKFGPLRKWIGSVVNIVAVVSLHGYTFRPHTSQKAAILFAIKPRVGRKVSAAPIVFYRSDKPGKTSAGDLVSEWRI